MRNAQWIATLSAALALTACGKSVGISGEASLDPGQPPSNTLSCGSTERWDFTQPQPSVNRAVDLLFVMDTSASLSAERARVSATIPSFIGALTAESDLRISVMLGHGGASTSSSRLYSAPGVPLVLNSKTQSLAQIQSQLQKTLSKSPPDKDEANGEALMYSFQKSLGGARLAEIQGHGFYRENAALSVVFLTDENDVCYPPELHGYTSFPDFVPSAHNWEGIAYAKYCSGVTPESVIESAKTMKANQKLSWAGIIHADPAQVPPATNGSEDSIGHGILELVRSTLDGVVLDISQSSYQAGLTQLANVVATQLDLQLSFPLDGNFAIQGDSVRVTVDGHPVGARFDSGRRRVEIRSSDAGHAGSTVEITACRQL